MTKTVVIGVILLSLTSVPVLFAFSKLNLLKNAQHVLAAAVCCCVAVVGCSALLFHRYFRKVDPTMYVFTFFIWSGVGSLVLGLELDGYISKMMSFYIVDGEPYLESSHGTMICYWDAVQSILLIAAIALYTHRESHREVTLYWTGSLFNSMIVLIPAAFAGPHKVTASMVFNILYIVAPALIAVKYFYRSPIQARSFLKFPPLWRRPVDLLFVIFFKCAAVFVIFRLLTVLGGNASCMKDYLKAYDPYLKDPNMFPKIQTLTYGYFFLAYYAMTIYGLVFPGQHWMADWAFIHAGAAAQAQFSYMTGALHHRTSKGFRPPSSGQGAIVFWAANILLLIVPQIFAFWCHRDPEKYGRTYTIDLASPLKTHVKTTVVTTTTIRRSPRKTDYSQKSD